MIKSRSWHVIQNRFGSPCPLVFCPVQTPVLEGFTLCRFV
uniref:Uncharacterized protein n=1 Tax=Anguilla anguilla TaxID=7936 RepID=A0A0E9QYH2_ANGAN